MRVKRHTQGYIMSLSKAPYKGTRDFFPENMRKRDFLFSKMREAAELFGYEPYDGPLLEEVDLYRAKSGQELINEQIYSFKDRGDREVAIRPEMTPTLARMVAQIHREVAKPLRWYAIPNLMRYEKNQRGRLREHWQFNCDIFGAPEGLGEVEVLELITHFLCSFGANENHFEVLINDRRIVDLVFNTILKLTPEESYALYKIVDRAKKISPEDLKKQAHLILKDDTKTEFFLRYIHLNTITELKHFVSEYDATSVVLLERLQNCGLEKYIKFDPSIVRGLDYYTGLVFEVFDKHPDNKRAIAGGGAYANLLKIFNEDPLPGIGFGLGDVTLTDFLESHGLMPCFKQQGLDLLIAYMDLGSEKAAFSLATSLRAVGIKTEVYLGEAKPKKVFPYSEKKGHHSILLLGSNEVASGEGEFKISATREQKKISFKDITTIKDFIRKDRP